MSGTLWFWCLSVQLHLIHYPDLIKRADEAGHFAVERVRVYLAGYADAGGLRHEKLCEVRDRNIVCRGTPGNQVAVGQAINDGGVNHATVGDAGSRAGAERRAGLAIAGRGTAGIGVAIARPVVDEVVGDFILIDIVTAEGG